MGAILLFCWHCHITNMLQCSLCAWPVPYVAALCILLSGLGLFGISSSSRLPIPNILGCAIFLFGLQRAVGFLLPFDSKLNMLLNSMQVFPAYTSRMALTSAIGFMLIGIAFIFWQRDSSRSIRNIVPLLMTVPVIFLGSLGIFTSILPFQIDAEFRKILMHLYTAVGMFLIGLGFLLARFHKLNPPLQE